MVSWTVLQHVGIVVFFFNDTATTEIYTLSLHDALPISRRPARTPRFAATRSATRRRSRSTARSTSSTARTRRCRSEEHTSELQSRQYLVCRLLLEKKKQLTLSRTTSPRTSSQALYYTTH